MARALNLARRGFFTTHPNPSVGCVIVKNDIIVGEGYHHHFGAPHAEVYALHMAGKNSYGATAYITLEPCSHYGYTPPCCEAIIASGIVRVIVAMKDPNPQVSGRGLYNLRKAGIDTICGLMMDEAEQLNKGFLKRMRTGLPYVKLKLGASLDGRTAMANGESKWITSKESRSDVQYMRACSHAILTSCATILADDPEMTVRWHELSKEIQTYYHKENLRQPLRIIIDSHNCITPQQRIMQQSGEIWFIRARKEDIHNCWSKNVRNIFVPNNNGRFDLTALLLLLGKNQINSILIEAGATLAGAFIQSRLVDELVIYLAPKLLGSNTRDLCILSGLNTLVNAPQFSFNKIRTIGPDLCLHLSMV